MYRSQVLVVVLVMACKSHGAAGLPPDAGGGTGSDAGPAACARFGFPTRPAPAIGRGARSLAVRDLDGDGKADLVTANAVAGTVSVLLGTGNGAFKAKRDYFSGARPRSVVLADLDGDGILDLVVGDERNFSVGNSGRIYLRPERN